MKLDFGPIIEAIARRADEFLTGSPTREEARTALGELLASEYPQLSPEQRGEIIAGVIRVLEDEDFFGIEFVGDPFTETDAETDS